MPDPCPACDGENWRSIVKQGRQVRGRQCRTCRYIQRRCTTGHWTPLDDYDVAGYCVACQRLRASAP